MKKIKDFIISIPIWVKILVCSIMFFVCIFIAILTENPVSFLAYFSILTAFFVKFCFTKLSEYINTVIHGRLTTGKVVNRFGEGKGVSYAWIQYSTKDGDTYQNTFPTIAFLFCPLIYNKNNPDDAVLLTNFIARLLIFLASSACLGLVLFELFLWIKSTI
ncbi:MAG: hypothetical protein K2K91_04225 [Ruminococcus sp.]|nr:hypothetical protein [Ruminococcus sp.]MDE7099297.1 hypothetical protein [Ruminococcus sp.]